MEHSRPFIVHTVGLTLVAVAVGPTNGPWALSEKAPWVRLTVRISTKIVLSQTPARILLHIIWEFSPLQTGWTWVGLRNGAIVIAQLSEALGAGQRNWGGKKQGKGILYFTQIRFSFQIPSLRLTVRTPFFKVMKSDLFVETVVNILCIYCTWYEQTKKISHSRAAGVEGKKNLSLLMSIILLGCLTDKLHILGIFLWIKY